MRNALDPSFGREPQAGGWLGQDLPCSGCGHNLRGVAAAANCPECGRPVRSSLAGPDLDTGVRDELAEALRSTGKASLLAMAAPLANVSCIGPIGVLGALIGSLQRLIAANHLRGAGTGNRRAALAAAAELAAGVPLLAALAVPGWFVPEWAIPAFRTATSSLWMGTVIAGAVASWELVDGVVARHALDCQRSRTPVLLALGAVPPLFLAAVLLPIGSTATSWIAFACLAVGQVAWIVAAALLAGQGVAAGDEMAAGARRRVVEARRDDVVGPRRARRPRPPEDDGPIPVD